MCQCNCAYLMYLDPHIQCTYHYHLHTFFRRYFPMQFVTKNGCAFTQILLKFVHYNYVIITMASQITSLTTVYSTFYSGADQRKHQSSASLAFLRWIHRWSVNSPHKGQVTRKMFPFDDVIMFLGSDGQDVGTDSDNDLARIRHQAISWINDNAVPWRIYVINTEHNIYWTLTVRFRTIH